MFWLWKSPFELDMRAGSFVLCQLISISLGLASVVRTIGTLPQVKVWLDRCLCIITLHFTPRLRQPLRSALLNGTHVLLEGKLKQNTETIEG